MNNRLWITQHDKDIIELTTKVTTIFTALEDIFAYKNMMIQLDDLKLADTHAASH